MSNTLHDPVLEQAFTLAEALASPLVAKGRTNPEQRRFASGLLSATSTIVELIDVDNPIGSHSERLEALASTSIQVVAEVIKLGEDGYNLSDVKAQLGVAALIVETLERIVGSSVLTGDAADWLSDQMHDQLKPFLRLAVRLSDPDKFEFGYVPDAWVQAGAMAMGRAAHLSHVIAIADAKARQARGTTELAA